MAEKQGKTYYMVAGERSGDLHGSKLIRELRQIDPELSFRAWGGDEMEKEGAEIVTHYSKMAFMGFWEVIKNIFTINKLLSLCKKDLMATNPDVLILIDYPGFNLRMAKFAHSKGIRVFYYISPKIWAWNQKRAYKIKKFVDQMFVILPFEKEFYKSFDYSVDYVGNPLIDSVNAFTPKKNFRLAAGLGDKPIIAILPGSRKQEIQNMLEPMVELSDEFPEYQFVVAAVSNLDKSYYQRTEEIKGLKVVYDQTYDLLNSAHAALVTSGTAALETALFNVPQVVCYKTSSLSYFLAKGLIKVDYISLVNLIAGKEVVRELIQHEFNSKMLNLELKAIIDKGSKRVSQLEEYALLKKSLSTDSPSRKTAELMIDYLKND